VLDFGDHPLGPLTQFGRVHCRAPRVLAPLALKLAAELAANRQPVTFRTYPTGHIEMMRAALPEASPSPRTSSSRGQVEAQRGTRSIRAATRTRCTSSTENSLELADSVSDQ
jgi:hypothetical protein